MYGKISEWQQFKQKRGKAKKKNNKETKHKVKK
jgi:hypothetical protein